MNRIHKLVIPVLLLMLCAALGASAQPAIKAGDGGSLPSSIDVDETFTVLVTENGSPVGAGTNVIFRLPHDTGDPVIVSTDDNGKVTYKPTKAGTLDIQVLEGTVTVAETTVDVIDSTSGTAQPSDGSDSGGSGGDHSLPIPTATLPASRTVTATATPTAPPEATPEVTPGPVATPVKVVETPVEAGAKTQTPPLKKTPKAPGFTSVFAIAGLLAALYLVVRQRE